MNVLRPSRRWRHPAQTSAEQLIFTPVGSLQTVPGSLGSDASCVVGDAFDTVARWIRNFLAQSSSLCGRSGPVCPYVPDSLAQGRLWLACSGAEGDGAVRTAIAIALSAFQERLTNTSSLDDILAVVVAFPLLKIPEDAPMLEAVHHSLKPAFVSQGLMLGQFYRTCSEPGLSNPSFRPLRSPVPLLAIRRMVITDIAFLRRDPDLLRHYRARFEAAGDQA